MNKLIPIVAFLSVMTMMTACGEGFKAKLVDSNSQLNQEVADNNSAPAAEAALSRHQEILVSYDSDFSNLQVSQVQALSSSIKAFDIEVKYTSHAGGASDVLQSITAKLKTDCMSSTLNYSSTTSSMERLKSMARISLGLQSNHLVTLQCVDAGCREIVAGVKRVGAGNEGMILLNLKRVATIPNSSTGVVTEKYAATLAPIQGVYLFVIDTTTFVNRCLQNINNQPLTTGSGSTVNPTTGGSVNGTNSGNAFGTSGNTAPYWNFDQSGPF